MINPALSYIGNTVIPILLATFKNLWENVLVPFGNFLSSIFRPIISVLSDAFTVLWKNIVVPLANFIGTTFASTFEGLAKIFNVTIVPGIKNIIDTFSFLWNSVLVPIGSYIVSRFGPDFEATFKLIGGLIDGLSLAFKGIITFITGSFIADWRQSWEGIKDIFKGVFNGIISIGEWAINAVIRGFNKLFSIKVADWIPEIGGKTFGIHLSEVSLPRFEAGGFPEDGLFMANHNELVGKFSNGQTAVANNEQITQGIAIAVQSANSEMIAELRRQNELLQIIANKPVIDKGDIVSAWKSGAKDFRKQTGRQLGIAY